jgi:hypothetical protein
VNSVLDWIRKEEWPNQRIVTYPAISVTNKTEFGFDNLVYWIFIQLVTTVHNHYLTQCPPLRLTIYTSQLHCTPLYSFNFDLNYD